MWVMQDSNVKKIYQGVDGTVGFKAIWSTILESISENETKVATKFYGHCPYPMNLMTFIGEKIIKDAQTQNLTNLKKILET